MKLQNTALAAALLSLSTFALAQGNASPASPSSSSGWSSQSSSASGSSNVREAQQALKDKGFDVGQVDGQMGPGTQKALREFQQQQNLRQTGNLDPQTLAALGVQGGGSMSTASSSQGSQGATSSGSAPASPAAPDFGPPRDQGQGSSQGASQPSRSGNASR